MARIRSKFVENLNPSEVRRCRKLTLGDYGEMRDAFDEQRAMKKTVGPMGDLRARAFLAEENGVIVGWALAFYFPWVLVEHFNYGSPMDSCISVYFFVDPKHRDKGVGSQLARAAHKKYGKYQTYPHDSISGRFFNKNLHVCLNDREVKSYA